MEVDDVVTLKDPLVPAEADKEGEQITLEIYIFIAF